MASAASPAPVLVRAPVVSLMVTVLVPLVGYTTVPKARSEFFVSVIG